jgi:uncharacterized membrane protein
MKNALKVLVIAVIAAVTGFVTLALAACTDPSDAASGGPEPVPVKPTDYYSIILDKNEYTFPSAIVGYAGQAPLTVTITNTSNQPTGRLTAALSWGSEYFTLTETSINSIAVGRNGTFTIAPKTGLTADTYTAAVTVSGGNNISAQFYVSFTVQTYSIYLYISGTYTFDNAIQGYLPQDPLTVYAANTGNQETGALTIALSGANANSFELSTTSLTSIPTDYNSNFSTFTVAPKTGLTAGTYTATVTVSGGNDISAQFDVSFTVYANYGISLSQTNTYYFTAIQGYSPQDPLTVTVTNTGDQETGALAIALSGANADSFELSTTSLTSIAGYNSNSTFTVAPETGLTAGTYTATVTVSGGNDISAQFDVSFTVVTYSISLDISGTYTFDNAVRGYSSQPSKTVAVTNTGSRGPGDLTIALSGTNASSFGLSTTSMYLYGGTGTFTVRPNWGLRAGTYTATVTVFGNNGINEAFNVSFTVTDPEQPLGFVISNNTRTYTGYGQGVTVGYANGITTYGAGDITVYYTGTNGTTYAESTTAPINAGIYNVAVTTGGGTLYDALFEKTQAGTLTISPKVTTFYVITTAPTYTGSPLQPDVTVRDGSSYGTILTLNTDYTVNCTNNINAGTANVTITGTGNYAGSSYSGTFTINRVTPPAPNAPGAGSKTPTSVTLTVPSGANPLFALEYARSSTTTVPTSGWQDELVFNDLSAGNIYYYFFARYKADTSRNNVSAASPSLMFIMPQTLQIITYWVEQGKLILTVPGNGEISRSLGQELLINVQGTDYSDQQWFVNGVEITSAAGQPSYVFSSTGRANGRYNIGLMVKKYDVPYYAEITITVTN